MELRKKIEGNILKVWIGDRFLFTDHDHFHEVINIVKSNDKVQEVYIYLKALNFLDSAALGMLLLIRDIIDSDSKKLVICYPTGQVKKLFEISCFYDLFEIIDVEDATEKEQKPEKEQK